MESPQVSNAARPLSPHLQVYRPQLTSVLSITHRITGVALAVGTLLLVYWLTALAGGPESYASAVAVLGSLPGQAALFVFTFAFCYHLCNGIRHLFWDVGVGFEMTAVYKSGRITVFASAIMTMAVWLIALAGG